MQKADAKGCRKKGRCKMAAAKIPEKARIFVYLML
jgi:hypothetical protein